MDPSFPHQKLTVRSKREQAEEGQYIRKREQEKLAKLKEQLAKTHAEIVRSQCPDRLLKRGPNLLTINAGGAAEGRRQPQQVGCEMTKILRLDDGGKIQSIYLECI